MKKKLIDYLIILTTIFILIEVLINKTIVYNTISYSLNIWVTSIIPSLFPFFIISDLLINYNIINYIPKFIKKALCNLFQVNDSELTIFLLSCFSGFPSNARNTKNLYTQKKLTKEEAGYILTFTHFSNPLFILSTVACFFLGKEKYGLLILLSHYLGNIIIGITLKLITPNKFSKSSNSVHYSPNKLKKENFSNVLINSIKSAIDSLLLILGTLTCFLVLSSLIINRLSLSAYPSVILKGILEITMGLKALGELPLPDIYKVVLSTTFISFGGLSVHMQVISQIVDTDISYKPYFIARIYHALISGLFSYILFNIFF